MLDSIFFVTGDKAKAAFGFKKQDVQLPIRWVSIKEYRKSRYDRHARINDKEAVATFLLERQKRLDSQRVITKDELRKRVGLLYEAASNGIGITDGEEEALNLVNERAEEFLNYIDTHSLSKDK